MNRHSLLWWMICLFVISPLAWAGPISDTQKMSLCRTHFSINDLLKARTWCELAALQHPYEAKAHLSTIKETLSKGNEFIIRFDDNEALWTLCKIYYALDPYPNLWCKISGKKGNPYAAHIVSTIFGPGYLDSLVYEDLIRIDKQRNTP